MNHRKGGSHELLYVRAVAGAGRPNGEKNLCLGAAAFFAFWESILPLITHRHKTTYRERLLAHEAVAQSIPNPLRLAVKSYMELLHDGYTTMAWLSFFFR